MRCKDEDRLGFRHLAVLAIALLATRGPSAGQAPLLPAAISERPNRGTPPSPTTPASGEGRDATSPTQMPARAWREVVLRAWREANDDSVGLVSAGVAFYGFLAMVPLLGAVVLTYGLVASPQDLAKHLSGLAGALPQQIAELVSQQLAQVVQASGSKKGLGLVAALAIALFGARGAAGGVISSLNIAYEEKETRGFVKVNLLALVITAAAVGLVVLALGAMAVLGAMDAVLPSLGGLGKVLLKLASYALLTLLAAAAAATLFRYGPCREQARWRWITPGTAVFAVSWMLLTAGLGFYASTIGHYNATYGSLAGVVVLLTWMYLSAYALLFGAELNSELEHQTARDTTEGPERPLGTRGAWAADHVAGGT